MHQYKENQRTLLITIHPPTHPPIQTIKVFKISKKPIKNADFETPILSRETHIKMQRLSSGPSRTLLSHFPSGDKKKCTDEIEK